MSHVKLEVREHSRRWIDTICRLIFTLPNQPPSQGSPFHAYCSLPLVYAALYIIAEVAITLVRHPWYTKHRVTREKSDG